MNRKKSSLLQYVILVGAGYLAVFAALESLSFKIPEPFSEGAAVEMEWMELEPSAGQPLPSSTPDSAPETLPQKESTPVLAAPEPAAPPEDLQVSLPAPPPEPAPKEMLQPPAPPPPPAATGAQRDTPAWSDPTSDIVAPSPFEEEVSYQEELAREVYESEEAWGREAEALAQTESFFSEPVREEVHPAPESFAAAAAETQGASAFPGASEQSRPVAENMAPGAGEQPSFGNPFVDPDAPPVGRHGVLDATSLQPAAGNPPPSYPATDRLARREGTVVLLGYVTPEGRLTRVSVEQEGSSAMTQESFRTFRSYRFKPGQTGWVRQTFRFTLKGSPQEIKGTLRGAHQGS